jgi:hypothetical protein
VTVGIGVGAGIAQQLVQRIGVRTTGAVGMLIAAFGLYLSSKISVDDTYLGDVLPAVIPQSIGMGLFFVPITLIATTNVGEEDAGLASGLFNTSQQVGGALGLAVLATLAADKSTNELGELGHPPSALERANAMLDGFQGRVHRRRDPGRVRRRPAAAPGAEAQRREHRSGRAAHPGRPAPDRRRWSTGPRRERAGRGVAYRSRRLRQRRHRGGGPDRRSTPVGRAIRSSDRR